MTVWLVFCSICILLVCEALIRAGYGAVFTAKVAGWSMLAALLSTYVPSIIPDLDGKGKVHVMDSGELNAWTYNQNGYNWRSVSTYRIMPTQPEQLPQETASANSDPSQGIDFMSTCGAGERRIKNRLDIADMNKKSDDRRC